MLKACVQILVPSSIHCVPHIASGESLGSVAITSAFLQLGGPLQQSAQMQLQTSRKSQPSQVQVTGHPWLGMALRKDF